MTSASREDTPIVRFDGISKSYDGRTDVVRSLDLALARGEFLTLLGPSGSGKTTTLMMLAGFEEPTRGTISIEGRRIDNVPPHKRGIGMVFQNYALFPHMTVAENLAFPLQMHGAPRAGIRDRVRRALDMVRLPDLGDRRPAQLSGGQQQRVAVARALIYEPRILLMDEPLGALDKQLREQMQLEIKHLHENLGLTVVYVTHDQSEALTMSDRIAVFHQGVVQQLATPSELYERPTNAFVAAFVGESNRLDGTVVARDGEGCSVRIADGSTLAATPVGDLVTGARVVLSVRPESIRLFAADGAANRRSASVIETIYLGDHAKVRVAVGGAAAFIVKVETREAAGLSRDAAVTISWDASACLAVAPDPR
ncbi:MAG: ABC transporter ATP-binding protein [Burkholderiales bacterium]|nr:ABC transporter ATP-binding protein [Burkholderiales bacterium]MCE7876822.1 ABC transporter ATP-binding protein [Betaproteobacteria bacterium PRO3]